MYGNQSSLPLREDMLPHPLSHYAVQKLTGEQYMRMYYEVYGLPTVVLRYFNVYGPRDDPMIYPPRLIPNSIYRIYNNESPVIRGDGSQTRDFTYVQDVVNATIQAALVDNEEIYGFPINIGTGTNTSIKKALEVIKNYLDKNDVRPSFKPALKEPAHTQADIEKAQNLLGWKPGVSLEKGIMITINWFKYMRRRF